MPADYIPNQELFLVRRGKLSYSEIEEMAPFERLWWIRTTTDVLNEEKRLQDQADQQGKHGR